MAEFTNPTDIARETLKLLASRRTPPTPQNYLRIYHEIAGTAPTEVSPQEWSAVMRDVLRQLDTAHRGITPARKREGLERLLINFGSDASLPTKLKSLVRSWTEAGAGAPADADAAVPTLSAPLPGQVAGGNSAPSGNALIPENSELAELRELLASTLEAGVVPRLERHPDVHNEAFQISRRVREARDASEWARLSSQLKQLWLKIELRVEPDQELVDNVMRLLALVVDNVAELVDDDQWIIGQVEALRMLVNQPADIRVVREAERSFKEVIYKQSAIKSSLREAKASLKTLLGVFIERLASVTENTVEYHAKIEKYADRISVTDSIGSLKSLVDELMIDTRGMQMDMMRSRDELMRTRTQAVAAETRVRELETELEKISNQVREDALTGTLNRRGMEDAMTREIARAQRTKRPLCIAVLDVDNFKRLNDTYGHAAGDSALVHLAKVIKHTVRPTDLIARYGGEEFIIILGDAKMEGAVKVVTRLQRELTKRFFLHDNERLLITFSAGVAEYRQEETEETFFKRADKAMYQAKLQGKNRVVAAE